MNWGYSQTSIHLNRVIPQKGPIHHQIMCSRSYSLHAAFLPHGLRREVGVAPGSVPVPGHGFRVVRDDDPEVLGDPLEEEPGAPQLVPHVDPLTRTDLELPLQKSNSDSLNDLIVKNVKEWRTSAKWLVGTFLFDVVMKGLANNQTWSGWAQTKDFCWVVWGLGFRPRRSALPRNIIGLSPPRPTRILTRIVSRPIWLCDLIYQYLCFR